MSASVWVSACAGNAPPARHAESVPITLAIDGDPNGIFWDTREHMLLLADDDGNRILSWTESAGISVLVELQGEAAGLGQLVRLPDRSIVAARFGHGTGGDVIVVPPGAAARAVTGLDPARRRIGLAVASDGSLYGAWFTKQAPDSRVGGVSELSLQGGERDLIGGLEKPIGVLVIGDDVYVSDQRRGQILVAPRSAPASPRVFATVPQPDLLAAGPDGSIVCGSASGSVFRVTSTGQVTALAAGFRQVRGVAYDPEGRRLFVVDHDPDASDGVVHRLHIVPID